MKIRNENNPPLPSNGLELLEAKINHPLPASYRSFLKGHNGGYPANRRFHIPDCQADGNIDLLLGIGRHQEDILDWIEEMDDLKGRFIPIGFDPGGNAVILDYKDGTIYYWDSARHFERSSDAENTYWIADSFSEFLDTLRLDES